MNIFDLIIYNLLFMIIITDFLFFEIKNFHILLLLITIFVKCILSNNFNLDIYNILIPCALFLLLSLMAYKNYIGGGDVKLITILSVSLSLTEVTNFLINMSLIGGIQVILYLIFKRKINKLQKIVFKITKIYFIQKILCSVNQKLIIFDENNYLKIGIPYGIAISIGYIMRGI